MGNFQPFDACVTPPHSQSCKKKSTSAGARGGLLQQGPGVGSRFSHFDKPLNVFIVVFLYFFVMTVL